MAGGGQPRSAFPLAVGALSGCSSQNSSASAHAAASPLKACNATAPEFEQEDGGEVEWEDAEKHNSLHSFEHE